MRFSVSIGLSNYKFGTTGNKERGSVEMANLYDNSDHFGKWFMPLLFLHFFIFLKWVVIKISLEFYQQKKRLPTRMVKDCRGLCYEERLEKLSLFSLARWRLRGDFILAYNLSNGSFDLPIEMFFIQPPRSSLRGHILKLHHTRFRLNRRKAAFTARIIEPWNKLPAFVVGSPSVDVSKSRQNACWTEVYPNAI